jgi:hypothetical protein
MSYPELRERENDLGDVSLLRRPIEVTETLHEEEATLRAHGGMLANEVSPCMVELVV